MKKFTSHVLTMLVAVMATATFGQDPSITLRPNQPGSYNIRTDSEQQVMRTYVITGVPADKRANVKRAFTDLLTKDGGRVEVAGQTIDGRDVTVLTVTASVAMQDSIAQTVAQANAGNFGFWALAPDSYTYKPRFRSVRDLADNVVSKELTSAGLVLVDERLNQLTVEDDAKTVEYISGLLESYDQPTPQIQVQLDIVETRQEVSTNVGLYLEAWKQALPAYASLELLGARGLSGLEVTNFNAVVGQFSPQALASFISYLAQEGQARVTHQTTVNVVNGLPAVVEAMSVIPYQQLAQAGDGTQQLMDKEAHEGVTITITGTLGTERQRLLIDAATHSIVGRDDRGQPLTSRSQVTTAVGAIPGKLQAVGGLKRTRQFTVRSGVPILKDIPVLRWLFSTKRDSREDWDVTLVVTIQPPK